MTVNKNFLKIISIVIITVTFWGCNTNPNGTLTIENFISTDKTELGKYINIHKYEPLSVKWVYVELNNEHPSQTHESHSYNLEAELYFKKETIEDLMNSYSLLSVTYKFINKGELGFTWLNKENKKKLQIKVDNFKRINKKWNDYEIDCYDPYFFKKGNLKGGGFIILDENTILIPMFTNSVDRDNYLTD